MFGNNPIRKPLTGEGNVLEVQEIFFTFQGEGPYVGWPAVFIRLGGCNLACTFCDTEFETFSLMSLEAIITSVTQHPQAELVVITGGEPFRQPIAPLCDGLLAAGYRVQIETNGTLYRPIDSRVSIICSPKHNGEGYHRVRPDLLSHLTALKFLVSASNPHYTQVVDVGQGALGLPVYVQPMDEYDEHKNEQNLEYALRLASIHGYRISLQLHKIMGIA